MSQKGNNILASLPNLEILGGSFYGSISRNVVFFSINCAKSVDKSEGPHANGPLDRALYEGREGPIMLVGHPTNGHPTGMGMPKCRHGHDEISMRHQKHMPMPDHARLRWGMPVWHAENLTLLLVISPRHHWLLFGGQHAGALGGI
ncbi:hypothetical protein GGX14DRAFT_402140 [Mycena pura]|uniref:Uncharacterized protein n=1 Tax=Mycena pura TaxID=153505 RepID=A0AAD6V2K1_9AGAR|nr:hypothetical protein GGX14DRAFT_402140 [Mycena pura]